MAPARPEDSYLVALKWLGWLFIFALIFLYTLSVYETLQRTFFVLQHSLHVLLPVAVLLYVGSVRFNRAVYGRGKGAGDLIVWEMSIAAIVVVVDTAHTVLRIMDAVRCTPVVCTEGTTPLILLSVASGVLALLAATIMVVLFNVRSALRPSHYAPGGRQYALDGRQH